MGVVEVSGVREEKQESRTLNPEPTIIWYLGFEILHLYL
jgi:hypothetical protein